MDHFEVPGAADAPGWLAGLPVPALACEGRRVLRANRACVDLLGRDPTGEDLGEVLRDPDPPAPHRLDGRSWRSELVLADGTPVSVDVTAADPCPDGGYLVVLRRIPTVQVLEESANHLDVAFETAPIGMAFFDTLGRYIRVNRALCDLLGREEEELLGRRDQELTHPEDRASDLEAAERILRGELDTWQTEKRFVRPCGAVVHVIANLTFLRDAERRPLAWLGQFQDITARIALEARLRELAEEDGLTGVANRRGLDREARRALALAARHGHDGALIFIDLDGFKTVNDVHGHAAGDRLLRAAADALRRRARREDTVARVGGDEFAVLLPLATEHQAAAACAGIQDALDAVAIEVDGRRVPLRASLGHACFGRDHTGTLDDLLARADRAMYAAKTALAG